MCGASSELGKPSIPTTPQLFFLPFAFKFEVISLKITNALGELWVGPSRGEAKHP